MKRILLFASALFIGTNVMSQMADFETALSQADTACFGQGQTLSNVSTFESGAFKLENKYSVGAYGAYTNGWSYSNITDITTAGPSNQYSNITGSGESSSQYGICNVSDKDRIFKIDEQAFTPTEVSVTNATYTYLSMENGDAFSAQFGDVNNASLGMDSLVLSIYGLDVNMQRTDSVIFYLADFTNGNTLLVNAWTVVDLSSLGSVYGLDFGLISSDNSVWGMNTPSYFSFDNLKAVGLADADFESPTLSAETKWNGSAQTLTASTVFTSGFYDFENTYNLASPTFGYSQAWSYSNQTDVITAGSNNQYSANTGEGYNSNQYAICNPGSYANNRLFSTSQTAFTPTGAYFTNTTFATQSMLNGDAYATQFGDISNAALGEDWFLLTIYGLGADSLRNGDSVNFYLADYRFTNDSDDYIIDEWTWVDLSSLTDVHGLDFELTSSDFNIYGILTPEYFAMDNFDGTVAGIESNNSELSIYPNPTNSELNISVPNNSIIRLFDLTGKLINSSNSQFTNWNISNLENGIYILSIETDGVTSTHKIVKQ
jgi:hypothetical protein